MRHLDVRRLIRAGLQRDEAEHLHAHAEVCATCGHLDVFHDYEMGGCIGDCACEFGYLPTPEDPNERAERFIREAEKEAGLIAERAAAVSALADKNRRRAKVGLPALDERGYHLARAVFVSTGQAHDDSDPHPAEPHGAI